MIRGRSIVGARSALAVVLILAGCSAGQAQVHNAREGGSIAVSGAAAPATLDPALATDPAALQALWVVYTPLLSYRHAGGRDGMDLIPGLARALPRVSDDGLTYTLRLRPGARYSNAAPVRPGDFERAVERLRALRSPLARLYTGIASIDADAHTGAIRITLTGPDPSFANVLALPSSAPVPRGTPATDLSSAPPPGAGAFRIAAIRASGRVSIVRRPRFRLPGIPAAHVDRVVLEPPESPARQTRAVISGLLDVGSDPAPDLLPEIRSKYPDRYREDATVSSIALLPDSNAPPFADPAVRRAVAAALDDDKLVRLYDGFLEPSCNMLPSSLPGYRNLQPCARGKLDELIAARKQVDEARAIGAPVSVQAGAGIPPGVAGYVARALRTIDLGARVNGRAGARLRIERRAPLVAHPSVFLARLRRNSFDSSLSRAVSEAMAPGADEETVDDAWAAADKRVVDEAYAVPLGSETRPTFLSERLDAENCLRFHPLFGLDFSSLCLK